jgi:hypothetical protein
MASSSSPLLRRHQLYERAEILGQGREPLLLRDPLIDALFFVAVRLTGEKIERI